MSKADSRKQQDKPLGLEQVVYKGLVEDSHSQGTWMSCKSLGLHLDL